MKLAILAVLTIALASAANWPQPTCDPSDQTCNTMQKGCNGGPCGPK